MVALDKHGHFWMNQASFLNEYLPGMSRSAYRNHLKKLVDANILIKVRHGGGRVSGGRGTTTQYRVNSPTISERQPAQSMLPEVGRIPNSPAGTEEDAPETKQSGMTSVFQRIEDLIAQGLSPEDLTALLEPGYTESSNGESDPGENAQGDAETCPTPEKHVLKSDKFHRNLSENLTGFSNRTCPTPEKHVLKSDKFHRNLSENRTGYPIHEEQKHEDEENAAAAANMSDTDGNLSDFFEILVTKLAEAGHRGIRAAQFEHLRELEPTYAEATGGVLPDERTAEYIVRRVTTSRDIRNVAGFVLSLTADVLRTGEGYEKPALPPARQDVLPDPETAPAHDWDLLHLAHVEQVASAQEVWAQALEKIRQEIARPAFETWPKDASGWAYTKDTFVIVTPNAFVTEMLAMRLAPVIERAVWNTIGSVITVRYTVEPQITAECEVCMRADARPDSLGVIS